MCSREINQGAVPMIRYAENMLHMHTWISSAPPTRINATEKPPRQSSIDRQMPVTTCTIDENNNDLRVCPNETTTTKIVPCDNQPYSNQVGFVVLSREKCVFILTFSLPTKNWCR